MIFSYFLYKFYVYGIPSPPSIYQPHKYMCVCVWMRQNKQKEKKRKADGKQPKGY